MCYNLGWILCSVLVGVHILFNIHITQTHRRAAVPQLSTLPGSWFMHSEIYSRGINLKNQLCIYFLKLKKVSYLSYENKLNQMDQNVYFKPCFFDVYDNNN